MNIIQKPAIQFTVVSSNTATGCLTLVKLVKLKVVRGFESLKLVARTANVESHTSQISTSDIKSAKITVSV